MGWRREAAMTAPELNLDLAAIKARLAAATRGPWTEDDGNIFSKPLSDLRGEVIMRRLDGEDIPHPDGEHPLGFVASVPQFTDNFEADADLIAHAPTDLAALVAYAEQLKSDIDSEKADAAYCRTSFHKCQTEMELARAERDAEKAAREKAETLLVIAMAQAKGGEK